MDKETLTAVLKAAHQRAARGTVCRNDGERDIALYTVGITAKQLVNAYFAGCENPPKYEMLKEIGLTDKELQEYIGYPDGPLLKV